VNCQGVDHARAREKHELSERHACRLVNQWRGTQRYVPIQRVDEDALTRAIITLASESIWVNTKEDRLAEIDGHLIQRVNFGGGLLGHLEKGGKFHVKQSEVVPGHWEIVEMLVDMKGKALFFKTINEQQDEVRSSFCRYRTI
jgi:hypothetical protein